jgi:hypothetical protein
MDYQEIVAQGGKLSKSTATTYQDMYDEISDSDDSDSDSDESGDDTAKRPAAAAAAAAPAPAPARPHPIKHTTTKQELDEVDIDDI